MRRTDSSVIAVKSICPGDNYYTTPALYDSVQHFLQGYSQDSVIVLTKDSVYKYESVKDIACDRKSPFEENGYGCTSYK